MQWKLKKKNPLMGKENLGGKVGYIYDAYQQPTDAEF